MESFNSRLRDELLNRELFLSLAEAQVVLDPWRSEYNQQRPRGILGWPPPNLRSELRPSLRLGWRNNP